MARPRHSLRERLRFARAQKRASDLRLAALHREFVGYRESNLLLRRQIDEQQNVLRRVWETTTDDALRQDIDEVLL